MLGYCLFLLCLREVGQNIFLSRSYVLSMWLLTCLLCDTMFCFQSTHILSAVMCTNHHRPITEKCGPTDWLIFIKFHVVISIGIWSTIKFCTYTNRCCMSSRTRKQLTHQTPPFSPTVLSADNVHQPRHEDRGGGGMRLNRFFKGSDGVFLFSTTSRLAPGPNQPPTQLLPGLLSRR